MARVCRCAGYKYVRFSIKAQLEVSARPVYLGLGPCFLLRCLVMMDNQLAQYCTLLVYGEFLVIMTMIVRNLHLELEPQP